MAAFDYVAVDPKGRTLKGVVSAPDEAAARNVLDRRRLMPLELSVSSARPNRETKAGGGRLGSKTLALTTRQLATLVAVSPVEEAVRTIALQSERPAVRRVLMGVHTGVLEGFRLSEAMQRQGPAFPPLYRAMVSAGESSGAWVRSSNAWPICWSANNRCAARSSPPWSIPSCWRWWPSASSPP